jgi:hypothetical protein
MVTSSNSFGLGARTRVRLANLAKRWFAGSERKIVQYSSPAGERASLTSGYPYFLVAASVISKNESMPVLEFG